MPYIKQERRDELETEAIPHTPGELNYLITLTLLDRDLTFFDVQASIVRRCKDYLDAVGTINYQTLNDCVGAVMCAGIEFYRRTKRDKQFVARIASEVISELYNNVAAPYEDKKIEENGDIPGYANANKL